MIKGVMTAVACVFCFAAVQAVDTNTAKEYWVSVDALTNGTYTSENPGPITGLRVWMSRQRFEVANTNFATGFRIVLKDGVYNFAGKDAMKMLIAMNAGPAFVEWDFQGRNYVTVTSESGDPAKVILKGDPAQKVRCFNLRGGAFLLKGLTICGFSSETRGGAFCDLGGDFAFANCVFANNASDTSAGAVTTGRFTDCVFTGNRAGDEGGVATGLHGWKSFMFLNCRFTGNVAATNAGVVSACHVVATNCVFEGNIATIGQGAAIWFRQRNPSERLVGCAFRGNRAGCRSGACRDGSLAGDEPWCLENCTFEGTAYGTAGRSGGTGPYAKTVMVKPGDDLVAVREYLRANRNPDGSPIEVIFEDGVYAFTNCVTLTELDSHETWKARHPGKVTLVGGTAFKGFDTRKLTDEAVLKRFKPGVADKILALSVPEELQPLFKKETMCGNVHMGMEDYERTGYWALTAKGRSYPIFTIDCRRMIPARWPNNGTFMKMTKELLVRASKITVTNTVKGADGKLADKEEKVHTNAIIRCTNPRSAKWALDGDADAYIFGFIHGCAYSTEFKPVLGRAPDGNMEIDTAPPWSSVSASGRFWFMNIMEELDVPGEWCYDRKTQTIYFYPPEGFSANSLLALGYGKDHLFRICGSDISLEGLRFTAKIAHPVVCIEYGRGNNVLGCTFSGLDYVAVFASGRDTLVKSCDFTDITAVGIFLVGCNAKTLDWGNNVVENCHIWNCCEMKTGWASGGVFVNGAGNRVSHCLLHGYNEHALDYVGVNQTVEYTRVYDASREFGDSAAVYSAGGNQSFGCTFRFNDVGSSPGNANAFYADDFSSGHTVYGNIFRNFGNYGIFFGGGRNNVVSNNIVTAGWGGMHIDNRGLFWPAYKDLDAIHNDLVKRFDYTNAPLATLYPAWAKWRDDGKFMTGYMNNVWVNNLMLDLYGDPTRLQICLNRAIPDGHVISYGNLLVRSMGPLSTNAVELWKFGGIRILDGSPEQPVDLGFKTVPSPLFDLRIYMRDDGWVDDDKLDHLRTEGQLTTAPYRIGDFNLKTDARLLKEIPGFQPIPFDKIGLYKDDWRSKIED